MPKNDYLIKGDMYQYDLGWLINELLSFKNDLETAIDLKTIKYADPIQWNITTQYPANTVVVDPSTGIAYMSKKAVPQGIQLSNTGYWTIIFDYAAIYNKIMAGVAFNEENNKYASKDMLVNDLVWFGGKLYRVTKPITAGGQYIPDTNIIITSIEELLSTFYGRDRVTQVLNDTLNVSGHYTINAGDIAIASENSTEKIHSDKTIDIDGNYTESTEGKKTIIAKDMSVHSDTPLQYGKPTAFNYLYDKLVLQSEDRIDYNVLVGTEKLQKRLLTYITVEEFGAIGDGIADDTIAINECLAYAKEHKKDVSTGGGIYKITENITIDGLFVDFNNGTIKSSNLSVSVINNATFICATLESTNIISGAGNNRLQYLHINEWTGTALLIDGGFECFIDHIRLSGNKNTETVGVDINASDCTIGYIYGYGAHTGIRVRGADNIIHDAHLWLNSNNLFNGSAFIQYESTFNTFISCACDSYETMCNILYGALIVTFIGCMWLNNNTLFKNKAFKLFDCPTDTIFAHGDITCRATGLDNNNSTLDINKPTDILFNIIDGDFVTPILLRGAKINNLINVQGATVTSASSILIKEGMLHVSISVRCNKSNEIVIDLTPMYMATRFSGAVYGTAHYNNGGSIIVAPVLAEIKSGKITIVKPPNITYDSLDTAVFNFTLF